jgi:hypothetical protein
MISACCHAAVGDRAVGEGEGVEGWWWSTSACQPTPKVARFLLPADVAAQSLMR